MSSSNYLPVDTGSVSYMSPLNPLDSSKQLTNYQFNTESPFNQNNNFIDSMSKGDLANPMSGYQNTYSYSQMPFYPNNAYGMYQSSCASYQPNIYQNQLLVQNLTGKKTFELVNF